MKPHGLVVIIVLGLLAGLAMGADGAGKSEAASNEFVPPPDAQWTLVCQTFTGLTHQADATRAEKYWIAHSGMPGFYVVHERDRSTLYYGYYRSINDPKDIKESRRAQSDRDRIRQLADDQGNRPFLGCIFIELVPKDPAAPAAWNLENAKGYWSLQVAVYESDPLRKQAAVDSVKDMRAHGIDAYYYHGPTASSICIGTWPEAAVKKEQAKPNPDEPVLVSNRPVGNGEVYLRSGQRVQEIVPKVQILDPSLEAMMKKYPYEAINGEMEVRDPNGKLIKGPIPSYVVMIPHSKSPDDSGASSNDQGAGQLPPAFLPPPPPPSNSAASGLRSIDSK